VNMCYVFRNIALLNEFVALKGRKKTFGGGMTADH